MRQFDVRGKFHLYSRGFDQQFRTTSYRTATNEVVISEAQVYEALEKAVTLRDELDKAITDMHRLLNNEIGREIE